MPILIRTAALGVAFGVAAAALTAWHTPELVAFPVRGLRAGALLVVVYGGLGLAVGCVLYAVVGLARRLRLDLSALACAPFLWSVGLTALAFVVLNEWIRIADWNETAKLAGRGAVLVAALVLWPWGWMRAGRGPSRVARAAERAGALLLVPAFLASAWPGNGTPGVATGEEANVQDLAPRFEPEPARAFAGLSGRRSTRVLLIGIDGASWDRIDAGIAAGRLPTFARLVERGVRAPLETLYPTYSPAIWTSMMTGVPPQVHGIEDFYLMQLPRLGVQRLRLPRGFSPARDVLAWLGELRFVPVTSSLRRSKALWNLADEAGLRSAVLGLWATWPPEPLEHGFVVSDHASIARRHEWLDREKTSELTTGVTTHPPELARRLAPLQRDPASVTREELERFLPVDDELWREFRRADTFSKAEPLSAFRSSHLNDAFYLDAALTLWKEEDPALLIVYARALDELAHFFYEAGVPEARELGYSEEEIARYGQVVDRTYAWTDAAIRPLVAAADRDPRTLLIVVSDHGWEKEPDGSYDHNHAPPGILILYGAGVCSGCRLRETPSIYDVAPTVLSRLGLPASEKMVGRPLHEAFEEPRPLTRVARYGPRRNRERGAIASPRDAELTRKLEALGYLE